MIRAIIPVLPALNIQETIMFYESKLKFKAIDQGGYTVLTKNGAVVHFFLCADRSFCENSRCRITVTDIECLYIDLAATGIVQVKGSLQDKPGGIKEFSVRDNNGILLQFIQERQ